MENILGYMSENEKDLYLLEASHDLGMKRFNFLFESVSQKGMLDMEEAELKVMQESGNFEDLDTLYEASVAETSDKKKGIISRMLSAIGKFIGEVLNKVAKVFNKDLEKKYEANVTKIPDVKMEKDPKALFNKLKEKANKCVNVLTHPGVTKRNEDGSVSFDGKKTAVTAGEVTVSAAALFGLYKLVKPWLSNIKDVAEAQAASNDAESDTAKEAVNGLNSAVKEGTALLNKMVSKMGSGLSHIAQGAGEVKNSAKEGISKATDAVKNLKNKAGKKDSEEAAPTEESGEVFGIDLGEDIFMESPNFTEDVDGILTIMESV